MTLLLSRRAIARPERALNVIGTGSPITPGATMTKVPGTTGDTYAGGGVTSGTAWRLVAPADGRYLVRANVPFDVSEAVEVEFGFVVNGTATGSERLRPGNPGATTEAVAHLVDSLDLSAGDYVEPFCRCTASGTASISVNLGIGLGIGMQRQAAVASGGLVVPVLPANAFTYIDASELAGAVSDPATAWNSLEDATAGGGPYNWTASTAGIIDESTMSGGRRSVLFNGSSQYMIGNTAIATALAGTDTPFTRYTHCQVVSQEANDTICGLGNSTVTNIYDALRMSGVGGNWVQIRSGAGGLVSLNGGTVSNAEFKFVEIHHGAARTLWVNDVKVIDAAAMSTGNTDLATVALAALIRSTVVFHSNIAVRRHGYWNVAFNDTQAQALPAVGT